MKVMIVGGGGREHAIAVSVKKSAGADKIYCAPGNAGIGQIAECVPIGAMEFDKLVAFAEENEIDLVIVGMDDPLVGGLVDEMEAAGIRTFGPRKNAAILEGSKAFSKMDLSVLDQRPANPCAKNDNDTVLTVGQSPPSGLRHSRALSVIHNRHRNLHPFSQFFCQIKILNEL